MHGRFFDFFEMAEMAFGRAGNRVNITCLIVNVV